MPVPRSPIEDLANGFARRHIGPSPQDIAAMLRTVGAPSLDALMGETLPAAIRQAAPLDLGPALSEPEALAHMAELASRNQVFTSLIGQGYYGTAMPTVIQRNILENPAWYTAYTPYQPEISQGRLEALFNFQTMICDLTGLDIANASLLDEGTAAAEAMALASARAEEDQGVFRRSRHPSADARRAAHPRRAARLVASSSAIRCRTCRRPTCSARCCNIPARRVALRDPRPTIAALHAKGGLAIIAADLLALTLHRLARRSRRRHRHRLGTALRRADGLWRAACRLHGGARQFEARAARPHRRPVDRFPRPAGLSAGAADPRAAHPPREGHLQHLHRAGAVGGAGLDVCGVSRPRRPVGDRPHHSSPHRGAGGRACASSASPPATKPSSTPSRWMSATSRVRSSPARRRRGSTCGIGDGALGLSLDETTTPEIVEAVWRAFGGALTYAEIEPAMRDALHPTLKRTSTPFLTQEVFHLYRSETELLRYMRKLADRDLALDRAMIPLGSCTMKLNATTEMMPLSLAGLRASASVRAAGAGRGLSRAVRSARDLAGADHRL